jgi:hypothetical protein
MVTLYVGNKRKKFTAHKKVICGIDYFQKAFNGRFKEAEEGAIYLPEDSAEVIGLFIHWLYREKIPDGNSQKYLGSLYDLYIFGEKIAAVELMDKTIDKIQDVSLTYDKYIDIYFLSNIYQSTKTMSELRFYGVHLLVYKSWKDKQDSSRRDPNPESTTTAGKASSKGAPKGRKADQSPFFTLDELDDLWVKLKDDLELFTDVLDSCQTWSSSFLDDPRLRDDENEVDRCWWHSHGEDSPCHQVELKEVQEWADNTAADSTDK